MRANPLRGWQYASLGAVMALAQAPVQCAFVLFPCLVFVLWAAPSKCPPWRKAFRNGWLLGLGYFAVALSWIVEPFLVDMARHGWMAPFGVAFMAGGMALFWGAGFAIGARFGPVPLAVAWAVAEALRGLILTGFPWADFAQATMDTPLAWLLPMVGPRGAALAVLLGAAGLAVWLRRSPPAMMAAATVAGLALMLFPGPGRGPMVENAPIVRLVQPNAPQDQKWDPAHIMTFFDRQISYTQAGNRPDLIVWPEMALPYDLDRAGGPLDTIIDAAGGVPVVLGLPRFSGRDYFNTMIVLGPSGVLAQYDKQHLVPFGEYIPLASVLGRLGVSRLSLDQISGYSAGVGVPQITVPGLGLARPLICYEAIFAEEVRETGGPRPRLLLLITNDAWFGNLSGPYQHLMQARMRALELGLPMVRVANTGVSAMIDARGNVTDSLPLNTQGALDAALPTALPPTIYARYGDWPAGALFLFVAGAIILRRYLDANYDSP